MQTERGSKNVVGARIAEIRASFQSPLTQDALSGRLAKVGLQLDRAAIAKIETGKRYVLDYELKAIAEVLGVGVVAPRNYEMKDATSKLRTATKRSKSDVANKLISMLLHELSGSICRAWGVRVDGIQYGEIVGQCFTNRCPYCGVGLFATTAMVEHLDGMNRYRVGLHVPGNVLVSCKRCNSEKRRDDSCKSLVLADSGWASFLSQDGTRCSEMCATCRYWKTVWPDQDVRQQELRANLQRIEAFRARFLQFDETMRLLRETLPEALTQLYSDCQAFARNEINTMLQRVTSSPPVHPR